MRARGWSIGGGTIGGGEQRDSPLGAVPMVEESKEVVHWGRYQRWMD